VMSACHVRIVAAEIGRSVQAMMALEAEARETHDVTMLHDLAQQAAALVIGRTVQIAARARIVRIEQPVPKANAPNSRPARHSPRARIGESALHPAVSPSVNIKTAPTAHRPNHADQSHLRAAGGQRAGGEPRVDRYHWVPNAQGSPFDKSIHAR